jgi:hypothetical protein
MAKEYSKADINQWMQRALDPNEQYRLAGNEKCPPEVLLWLAQNMQHMEYSPLASNPSLTEEIIEFILRNSTNVYQKAELIQHPNFNTPLMDIICTDADPYTRAEAVRYSSDERLEVFAHDPDPIVRAVVAENPYTPKHVLLSLLNDPDPEVVERLTENQASHSEVWSALLERSGVNGSMAMSIARNVPSEFLDKARTVMPPQFLHYFLYNDNIPRNWIDEFFENPDIDKEGLATIYLSRQSIEPKHIPYLIGSKHVYVRERIAAIRPLPMEFQKNLVKDKSASVRASFAMNPTADPELLMGLLGDKSVTVLSALQHQEYWDTDTNSQKSYAGRENLIAAASGNAKTLESKTKTKSVAGRSEALQDQVIDKEQYAELMKDKSIGIQTSATLRAAELGIISFKEAATFVAKHAPQTTAPKNRWVELRMEKFRKDNNEAYLDLVIELQGDQILAMLFIEDDFTLTEKQILKIAKAHLPITNWNLAKKVTLTPELLNELAETPSFSYDTFGTLEENLEFGRWAGETTSGYRVASYPQAIAANHPETPRETLEKLKKSRSKYVRGVIFSRKDITTAEDVKAASKDKDAYVRCLVAKHELVTLPILEKLASDKDPEVRKLACEHPQATPEMKAAAALLS